ncbi:hypothetical protein DL765_006186 [Monosporascus sp. GIB2]|nr:hypothetical protein DL765_006186 [Monosporascus sp. GIB2]
MALSWLLCLSLVVVAGPRGVLSDRPALVNDYGFDQEAYGLHPMQKYRTIDAEVPLLNIIQYEPQCDKSLYTMMAPRGGQTQKPQVTILDPEGNLVWTMPWKEQQLYNLMVQEYRGEKYLTFWAGDDTVGGHGAGKAYMLDKNYNIFRMVNAANGRDLDLHDFRITKDGTALLTIYELYDRNLTELGQDREAPVWDCIIQEVDLDTGEALFEWRAMLTYPLGASFKEVDDDKKMGWDYFHINSVDKDSRGNYLVSSRYMHSLTYINGTTGDVIWILGGKMNMFKDLSGGNATSFQLQHDARWSPDEKTITMFDNKVDDWNLEEGLITRGLRIQVDEKNMTVKLVTEYINPHQFPAKSQGSLQELPNGNVLLGYGDSAAFTEFTHDGVPLCDTHFAPESRYTKSDVESYRVYKYEWHGWPTTKPDAVLAQDTTRKWNAYVSWNGATEVRKWVLQGSKGLNDTQEYWQNLDTALKKGFETSFEMKYWYPTYLRLVAKDSRSNILGVSEPLNSTEVGQVSTHRSPPSF